MIIGLMEFLTGILQLLIIILIETAILSKTLSTQWGNKKVLIAVFMANLASTVAGMLGLLIWLDKLVLRYLGNGMDIKAFYESKSHQLIVYLLAFIITLLIEIPVNSWFLKKYYPNKRIIVFTIIANLITYVLLFLYYIVYL